MKRIILFTFTLLVACAPSHSQITLNAGDTFTYQFSTLPFYNPDPFAAVGSLWSVDIPPFSANSPLTIRLETFENDLNENPIASRVFDSTELPGFSVLAIDAIGAWQDLQGAVRITMLSGSWQFNALYISAALPTAGGDPDLYLLQFTPVPEPATISLLLVSSLGFGVMIWRGRKRI
jgi:hypothetical protein